MRNFAEFQIFEESETAQDVARARSKLLFKFERFGRDPTGLDRVCRGRFCQSPTSELETTRQLGRTRKFDITQPRQGPSVIYTTYSQNFVLGSTNSNALSVQAERDSGY